MGETEFLPREVEELFEWVSHKDRRGQSVLFAEAREVWWGLMPVQTVF